MTPISPEACARLDRVKPTETSLQTESAFQATAVVDKRPWLAHAFTALLQIQREGRNEPGIGDFRISDATLNVAGRVLGSVRFRSLPNPTVSALPGGGIQINWSNSRESIEVSISQPNAVGVAYLIDDDPIKIVELGAAEYDKVNDFLTEISA